MYDFRYALLLIAANDTRYVCSLCAEVLLRTQPNVTWKLTEIQCRVLCRGNLYFSFLGFRLGNIEEKYITAKPFSSCEHG